MLISREGETSNKAIYFDNEGHAIPYAITLSTDAAEDGRKLSLKPLGTGKGASLRLLERGQDPR
ncbi:MAG: hypothetical protein WAM69_15485 [Candidatus Sulfotelmatobacter sp.]